jgi:peptidoglycan/LPS O-acetylase OafA/YrhL
VGPVTGLIYVAIVALWAAVLIPMWLRRHDDDEERRRERHEEALGVLARFRSANARPISPARRAARRRRAIALTLVALLVAGGAGWMTGVVGAWALITPLIGLVLFVGIAVAGKRWEATQQARKNAAEARERSARARSERESRRTRVAAAPRTRVTRPRPQPALDRVFDQTA